MRINQHGGQEQRFTLVRKDKTNSEGEKKGEEVITEGSVIGKRSEAEYSDGKLSLSLIYTYTHTSWNLTCCSCPWKEWLVEAAGRVDHRWRRLLVPGQDHQACLRAAPQCCSYPRRQEADEGVATVKTPAPPPLANLPT